MVSLVFAVCIWLEFTRTAHKTCLTACISAADCSLAAQWYSFSSTWLHLVRQNECPLSPTLTLRSTHSDFGSPPPGQMQSPLLGPGRLSVKCTNISIIATIIKHSVLKGPKNKYCHIFCVLYLSKQDSVPADRRPTTCRVCMNMPGMLTLYDDFLVLLSSALSKGSLFLCTAMSISVYIQLAYRH